MEIRFIYPETSAKEFFLSMEAINEDIADLNAHGFLPRLIVRVLLFVLYIVYLAFLVRLFDKFVFYITAKNTFLVGVALCSFFLAAIFVWKLVKLFAAWVYYKVLDLFKIEEYEESYTFSPWAERNDPDKNKKSELAYYHVCDILKNSDIDDASLSCEGDVCKVDVSYVFDDDKKIAHFKFFYHEAEDISSPVVDFDRKVVLFPKSKGKGEIDEKES